MSSPVWLITGCSSGLGLELARAVLKAGHRVIATSRNPDKAPDLKNEIESTNAGKWVQLDVTDPKLEQKVEECMKILGTIDVLVNNAGYAVGGPFEDTSVEAIRAQFETNFFGPVRLMKALIPHMRERKTGTIINVTSTEGLSSAPGISVYGSSKFALEGISEGLHAELAGLGIRVMLIEPGGMRTSFLEPSNVAEVPLSEPYKGGIVDHVIAAVRSTSGQQMLDPVRSAQRIVEAVAGGGEGWPEEREQYLRLLLGKEVIGRINSKVESLQSTVSAFEKVWSTVDFDS